MKPERMNVTESVVRYLTEHIQNGDWPVGSKIPSENQLTEQLGVSRASVRVAIQQLIGVGVLESEHGKGTFLRDDRVETLLTGANQITPADCADIRAVLEFRRILEPESAALAAKNAAAEQIAKLRELTVHLPTLLGQKSEFVRCDIAFHEALCQASGNHLLVKSLHEVFAQTVRNHVQLTTRFGEQDALFFHPQILDAVEARNANRARALMEAHILQNYDRV
ncbi:FadR/GntR family transcriptional regulator [Agathobaculum sp.]|uniref:FadR/GntR family transcriptional regulator n=1 Tax=Agathobaculum sp. TaxID=2048138 RepID=UPI002A7F8EC8|nr:FCD domain-containing protein [Agathobaculum sp.]MDY3618595.1 FCD domain-containing protein [Agathobaculum sp.]